MSVQLLDDDGNVIKDQNQPKPQLLDDSGNAIGEHAHSGLTDFLASMPEKTNEFLSKHPIINDLLFGAKKTPQGHNLVGPEPMHVPGVRAGFDYLANKIDNPQGEGGYGRGFAAGALHGFGDVASALNPLPKIPEPVGRVDFIPGEEAPNVPKGTDFEGIRNNAVDAEIVPDFKASNEPIKQLEPFNHDLPAEFAPVDSAVDVSKFEGIQTQTSPDELGYNNVLENQGKKELEPLPKGWEYTGEDKFIPPAQKELFESMGMTAEEINSMSPEQADELFNSEWKNQPPEELGKGGTELDTTNPDHMEVLKQNLDDASNNETEVLATVSNEHQVLTRPDTIRSMTGVEDGFLEPKFEEDRVNNSTDGPIPEPGFVKRIEGADSNGPDGVSSYDSQFNSTHKILDRFDSTRGIGKALTDAQDIKPRWLYGKFREFSDISKGLNKDQRKQLSQLINQGTEAGQGLDVTDAVKNPSVNHDYGPMSGISSDLIERAQKAKSLLDDVHEFMMQMGVKSGTMGPNGFKTDLGYLSQYFPHMKRGPEGFAEQIKDIWSHYLGKENPFYKIMFDKNDGVPDKLSNSVGDMYDKGTSTDPWSAFTMQRNNLMKPEDIEWDFNKVIPAYLESVAKVAFDGPAVEKAEYLLKQNAESMSPRLKQLAENAILNYSGYDAKSALTQNWDNLARSIANRVSSSLITFNPGLHLLHLGEIPADILPGLGPRYTTIGIKDFGLNIRKNFQDMAKLGLLQDEVKPMSFKTTGEKISSIGYFRSYIESIVKGIAYRGALAKYLDQGLSHPDAVREAIKEAKDLTLTVDKARQMQTLTPESKAGAGGPVVRLAGQYKGIPLKYIEQQQEYFKALVDNPKAANAWGKVALSILGAGGALAFGNEVNKKFIHIESPTDLFMGATAGPFAEIMKRMVQDTERAVVAYKKGDMQQAQNYFQQSIVDVATLFTPGGAQIRKVLPDSVSKPGSTGNKGKMRLRFQEKLKP